ncbi:MoaD/ThiS family protein [Candidatus Methylacidiphilum fumarolicum]|uniref:Molybdopterin synthase sulfur carrier subunit n=2 Tax=Candidatus Methylacidiphilum fumarolicum TaxID=591154 RepID=I0JYY0_METFB|nr:ubiquitin-like small modifier protein 1 [Candidatus Methylacidiphilum fumarolicum]MBW6415944.1 MoaD/ThiS family protein [Candidatus Methylacidiphilum fumarolicum]TFE68892.1 molybdopterin synthase sulfur carrier subunit [Candidatus Methylacidiphilum fumarolicum]TFE71515.1 MoaD/ThiS family protein [Candidatus Methylacidiphilum fumarolicum]TFE71585.1 MoaD/ThiS family protein [Candidatus Methylacidiphilum fumarolicum]TFE76221.1 molybdopterin synthase sulfur carrier subunit [Candidatus Methylaci
MNTTLNDITVRIPTPLRGLTQNKEVVYVSGKTIKELLLNLETQCPGILNRICNEKGEIRRFVNVYLNGEDIRFLNGLDTPLQQRDEVSIVPAIAGG